MTDRRAFLGSAAFAAALPTLGRLRPGAYPAGSADMADFVDLPVLRSHLPGQGSGVVLYPDARSGLAAVAEGDVFAVAGDGTATFALLYRKVAGVAVEQARYASKTAFEGPGGAASLGYGGRTVAGKLDDVMSVFDFMTPAEIAGVLARAETHDVTDAFNRCFAAAQTSGRTVHVPDGTYIVGNLLFGAQHVTSQSPAPLGLVGQSRGGAYLKARPGLTGTLLQSWSVAGVRFSDFTIDVAGTAAMAWDCSWRPDVGPSTQCIIHAIRVIGGTSPTIVSLRDMNDTYPDNLLVAGQDSRQCGIDMTQTGGLSAIRNSHWPFCFLRFGTQAGLIDNCVGMGIEFALGGLNYVTVLSGQLYANTAKKSLIWSQSFQPGPSSKAITIAGTTLIGDNGGSVVAESYLNLNLASSITLEGCQFLGSSIPLLGPDCRADTRTTVRVRIRGGARTPLRAMEKKLILNDRPGFIVTAEDFLDDATGQMVSKDWNGDFLPRVFGASAAGIATYGEQTGTWRRNGNEVRFDLRVSWSGHTGRGPMHVGGLPFPTNSPVLVSVFSGVCSRNLAGVKLNLNGDSIVVFATDGNSSFAVPVAGEITISGSYPVAA